MDTPFAYNRFVVGADFLSRKNELNLLTSLLHDKHHALIYDAPKTGKRSLVQQTLLNLQKVSYPFNVCDINLLNIRDSNIFLRTLANQIASCVSNTLSDWNSFSEKYLSSPSIDSTAPLTDDQMVEILSLPERICEDFGTNIIIYLEEFQNILFFDDSEKILKTLEKVWPAQTRTTYLITGSQINAMKYIFEEEKYLYNFAEHVKLYPLEEKAVCDNIIRTFLKVGRVVEQSQAQYIYQSLAGHPWYIWHLSNICFNLTKGYLNDKIIQEATTSLLSTHDIRFREKMNDLSNFQISFLKAIFDGVTKFSSKDVIDNYHLNSSANVNRLKDALKKKEVVSFDENDIPVIIDPLFKIWLGRYFFVG